MKTTEITDNSVGAVASDGSGALLYVAYPAERWRLRGGLRRIDDVIKHVIDFTVAPLALLFISPVFLIIAILIALDGGPVLFSHVRVGQNGKPFRCLKFRSMVVRSDAVLREHLSADQQAADEWSQFQKLSVDPRITRIGAVIRKWSLDELPQLLNVLRGEMSLVGPRPVTQYEWMERYGPYRDLVASVRPGITGAWQVSGRSMVSYEERVALDVDYVINRSLATDLGILLKTFPTVVLGTGR